MFVLNVDLWSEDATREVNLVRHSNNNPAVGNILPVSYNQLVSDDSYAAAVAATAHGGSPPVTGPSNTPTSLSTFRGGADQAQAPGQQNYQAPYNPYPQGGPPQVNPYSQQQAQQALPSPPYERQPGQYQQGYAPAPNGNQYPPQNPYNGGPPPPQQQPLGYYTGAAIHAQGHGPPMVPGGGPVIAPDGSSIPSVFILFLDFKHLTPM